MTNSEVIKNLQTDGFSMLEEIPFSEITRKKVLAYAHTKINDSNRHKKDIIFKRKEVFLAEESSYSSVRILSKLFNKTIPEKTVIYRRHDSQERGLFLDIIHPDLQISELRKELYSSTIFGTLKTTCGISESDVEFHIYYTNSCVKPRSWHIDGPSLKIFTYLTYVADIHGPYAYQLKSQRHYDRAYANRKALSLSKLKSDVSRDFFNSEDVISPKGKEGTSFISNQAGIHRGLDQKREMERVVLVTQFL